MSTSVGPHSKDAGEVWPWHRSLSWVFSIATTLVHPGGVLSLLSHLGCPLGSGTTCIAPSLWSNVFTLIAPIPGNTHRPPAFPALPQHGASAWDTDTCPAAPLPPLSSALPPPAPGDGGQGRAAQQLCPAPRRWNPSTRHIHPSPDPGMAIPRLGLSPGNPAVSCRVGWEGGGGRGTVTRSREAEEPGVEGALDQPRVLWLWPPTRWVISRCAMSGLPLFLCGRIYK